MRGEERNAFVLVHQHGHRDVTRNVAIQQPTSFPEIPGNEVVQQELIYYIKLSWVYFRVRHSRIFLI